MKTYEEFLNEGKLNNFNLVKSGSGFEINNGFKSNMAEGDNRFAVLFSKESNNIKIQIDLKQATNWITVSVDKFKSYIEKLKNDKIVYMSERTPGCADCYKGFEIKFDKANLSKNPSLYFQLGSPYKKTNVKEFKVTSVYFKYDDLIEQMEKLIK